MVNYRMDIIEPSLQLLHVDRFQHQIRISGVDEPDPFHIMKFHSGIFVHEI